MTTKAPDFTSAFFWRQLPLRVEFSAGLSASTEPEWVKLNMAVIRHRIAFIHYLLYCNAQIYRHNLFDVCRLSPYT
jgi:hypothetical protein